MALHSLAPTPKSLHGHWSRDLAPALVIDDGDTVRFSTLDALWCGGRPQGWPWKRISPPDPINDIGHALTGPVAIRGARAGMVLEIQIGAIVPDNWGWTWAWPQGERARALGVGDQPNHVQLWEIDPAALLARDERGRHIRLKPFMGVMGVAPVVAGIHATRPPRVWGGNIDCKELVSGTTLLLPIGADGALFSVGDGHGAQGDGEICGTALECPMTQVDLTFKLRVDLTLSAPRARVDGAWITFGFDSDLEKAALMATNGMLDLIRELQGVGRSEALALASIAADLRITQMVNEVQGVHCVLRDGAFAGRPALSF